MDNEFPDESDLYQEDEDELEVWRELEGAMTKSKTPPKVTPGPSQQISTNITNKPVITSSVAVNFPLKFLNNSNSSASKNVSQSQFKLSNNNNTISEKGQINNGEISQSFSSQLNNVSKTTAKIESAINVETTQPTRKRTIEEILRDVDEHIGPITFDDEYNCDDRFKRPKWDNPDEIIKILTEQRKLITSSNEKKNGLVNYEGVITKSVPTYNFIPITKCDEWKRFYIKMRHDYQNSISKEKRSITGLLPVSYNQLKNEANKILTTKERTKFFKRLGDEEDDEEIKEVEMIHDELWVDKYRPKKYIELLSDEKVNLRLIRWLKLWDKIVFDKELSARRVLRTKLFDFHDEDEIDGKGNLKHKIALLSGPPGLGKTTLAHVVARHAGYNVVELNASDDRTPEAFREILLSSTQMKSLLGPEKRPNCLIIDEIDGATSSSIELLLKFVDGKLKEKGKSTKERFETCHRPVICICNEIYTPALRPLKAAALVIPVPAVDPSVLTDRLMTIAENEQVKVHRYAVEQLVVRSNRDIRTCLGALQYMGGSDLDNNLSLGIKDTKISMFDAWKTIFHLPVKNKNELAVPERVQLILKTVHKVETEKLIQGVHHNYPEIYHGSMDKISTSLDWLEFYDVITTLVYSQQSWSVMPYTNYLFVVWHLNFAVSKVPLLQYPSVINENKQKLARTNAILESLQKHCGVDKISLCLDFTPFFPDILNPKIRSTPTNMFRSNEKGELMRLINIMLDYGFSYIQEKLPDGSYVYKLDPNVYDVGLFPGIVKRRIVLSYAAKQVLIRELEAERLKRESIPSAGEKSKDKPRVVHKLTTVISDSEKKNPGQKQCRDFFANFRKEPKIDEQAELSEVEDSVLNKSLTRKSCVRFKFKEGFTKVQRKVFMKDLL